MRLGIGSYSYAWAVGVPGHDAPAHPLTVRALLEKAAELGVRVVQIADNLPLHRATAAEIDALRAAAEAQQIELELGTSGIDAENLTRYLGLAQCVGARLLRTLIDTPADRPEPDEVVARLAPLVPAFERSGVTLAIENHDRFKARTLRSIVERLGSDRVGVCLDTANSIGCMEGPEHIVAELGNRTVNLHVKDVRVYRPSHHKGFVVEGCAAGEGQLDVPWLLGRLRELGARPNVIVELWPAPEATIDATVAKEEAWVRASVAYLRTLITE